MGERKPGIADGDLVDGVMRRYGWSDRFIASAVGVSVSTVHGWRKGTKMPVETHAVFRALDKVEDAHIPMIQGIVNSGGWAQIATIVAGLSAASWSLPLLGALAMPTIGGVVAGAAVYAALKKLFDSDGEK
jgi:hypothetical protein